ncbi:MAG: 16S rRNA (uracil(1498)-N(3))-methyltransferase [Alphaproteobacteria bacterium]|nr:16S rRNA (uracil(1498)-N(3))-methyltransferase [Alphaproteobacteria bacterium]
MSQDLTEPGGLTRLFVEQALTAGAELVLDEDQSHFLANVLRAKAGDAVRLFNGRDGEWRGTISALRKRAVLLQIEKQTTAQSGVPDLWLCLAPIKRTPLDYVTQKATELGVSRVQPVLTRRTIVERINLDRMRANAVEAAEQSGRLTVPEIAEPVSLDKMLRDWQSDRRLVFCDEAGDAPPAAQAMRASGRGPWAIVIGPEGGFTPEERAGLRQQPFVVPVSLGPRIMRADTAALAALALWQSTLGDWG